METLKNRKNIKVIVTILLFIIAYTSYSLLSFKIDKMYFISSQQLFKYEGLLMNSLKNYSGNSYLSDSLSFTDKGNVFYSLQDGSLFFFELYNLTTNESTTIKCSDSLERICDELCLDTEERYVVPSICFFREETQDIYFSIETQRNKMIIININLDTNEYRYTREIGTYGDGEYLSMYFGVTEEGEVVYGDITDRKLYKYNFCEDKEVQLGENAKDVIISRDGKKIFFTDYEGNAFVHDGVKKYELGMLYQNWRESNESIENISFSDKGNYLCITNYKMIFEFWFKPSYISRVYIIDYRKNNTKEIYSSLFTFFNGALIRE